MFDVSDEDYMDGRSLSTNPDNVPPLDFPPVVNEMGKSPSSTSLILPSLTADLSSDGKSLRQVTDETTRGSNARPTSLALENHFSADSRQNNLTSEGGKSRTLFRSGSTEPSSIDGAEMPTRTSAKRSSGPDRMELPISFAPPDRLRTESKDTQSRAHPVEKLMKFSLKLLVMPLRVIMSIVKFLVLLLCIITSIVWAIPCIILSVAWTATIFICAGDRCGNDDDDEDDAFDNFMWWGLFPCCGSGFFAAIAFLGWKCIWSIGKVLVNPDNTSGLNNWIATPVHDMLDSF